jgi:hypothetical protein
LKESELNLFRKQETDIFKPTERAVTLKQFYTVRKRKETYLILEGICNTYGSFAYDRVVTRNNLNL